MSAGMTVSYIVDRVSQIREEYGETGLSQLADEMGVVIEYESFGTSPGCLKGFFMMSSQIKYIAINCDLPEEMQRVILAHELGHSVLHCDSGGIQHDWSPLNSTGCKERDANIFAAELLLSDEGALRALKRCSSFGNAARKLHIPPEILYFKCQAMKSKGYRLNVSEFPGGAFLKNM